MNNSLKTQNKRQINKENNRSLIIDAGINVFLEKGISNTTVRDIIRKTSLASGTFYNYFKSKEEVLIAALDDVAILIGQELRDQRSKARNLEEFVSFQVRPFFEFAQDHSDIFMILNSNLNDVQSFNIETPMMSLELEYLKEDVIKAIKKGILPDVDVDYFCAIMRHVTEGVALSFITNKNSNKNINESIKFCTNFIVNGFKANFND
tara:strand:- start:3283 stop:3903 length:621 start_codon:yes stop_codon:yes gene_type:complete